MRKKLYFVLCMAACFMAATACHKNNSAELTTSAYKDTVSDMEKTTESQDSSDASSTDNKKTTTKGSTTSSDSTTKTSSASSTSADSKTTSASTASSTTAKNSSTTSTEEDITAEGDENFEEPTTATKDSEKETWAASGTLSGFIDSDSVEIVMEDGSVKTFFVYDEDIANQLEDLLSSGDDSTINFVSRPIAGQANSQIIEIK